MKKSFIQTAEEAIDKEFQQRIADLKSNIANEECTIAKAYKMLAMCEAGEPVPLHDFKSSNFVNMLVNAKKIIDCDLAPELATVETTYEEWKKSSSMYSNPAV